MKQKDAKRNIALILSICLISVSFFAAAFIIIYADHDCVGEHCQVCIQADNGQNTLKQLKSGDMNTLAVIITSTEFLLLSFLIVYNPDTCTPVTWKVRLNH